MMPYQRIAQEQMIEDILEVIDSNDLGYGVESYRDDYSIIIEYCTGITVGVDVDTVIEDVFIEIQEGFVEDLEETVCTVVNEEIKRILGETLDIATGN